MEEATTAIVDQTLRDGVQEYPHPLLFATVTGSHAFGCAAPTSDYDVHGVHLLSLEQVLGLDHPRETVEQKMPYSGDEREIDIVTHDLRKFVLLLLKGNGNVLEDLYSPLVVFTSPVHEELKALGRGCITKRLANHYQGMAFNQQRRMRANEIKKFLHAYRCLLMGMHVMRTGELVFDLDWLSKEYGYGSVYGLIAAKRQGYDLTHDDEAQRHNKYLAGLAPALGEACEKSALPESPSAETRQALEQLVIWVRMAGYGEGK
jgi:predicted nucleotidyltransferase